MESFEYETDFSALEPDAQQPAPAAEPVTETPVNEVPADAPAAAPVASAEPVVETPTPARKVSPFADSPYVTCAPTAAPARPAYAEPAPRRKKRSVNWLSAVTILLVLVLTVSFAVFIVSTSAQTAGLKGQITSLQTQIKELQKEIKKNSYTGNGNSVSGTPSSPDGLTPGQVYAQNIDSVVLVNATTPAGVSTGSGFVLTEDGYVVTNYHVVEGGTAFHVTTSDGTKYLAVLTGGDETNDVAVLKVNGVNLDPVELGSSDDLIVGDQVLAIGNPLGELTSTLTVGYVSAKNRDVNTDGTSINMLQTDASINSGNSGGPLFNMKGQVIGITTAKYSGATSSGASIEGIGFAIPIDDVKGMVQEIISNGYVSRPYLGVYIRDTAEGIGVYVDSVEPFGPADVAGLRSGDIIVQLGDDAVSSINELSRVLYGYKVGDTVTVTVYRNRQLVNLTITLTEKPQAEN